jgi:hypothetical protein
VGVVSVRSRLALGVGANSRGVDGLGAIGETGFAKSNGRGASGFSKVLPGPVVGEDMR